MHGRTLRNLLVISVFSVVSFVLGLIKFGGTASIALDSFPGYFVAGYFGPSLGGAVASLAHILSAAVGGFPLGGVHILVAAMQFAWAFIFGIIPKYFNNIRFIFLSGTLAVLFNGIAAPILTGILFPNLAAIMRGLIPFLLLASAVNIALAISTVFVVRKFGAR